MFVEEGFRIRFANGEAIDFYADKAADKEAWMRVLSNVVGSGAKDDKGGSTTWCDVVLRREALLRDSAKAEKGQARSQGLADGPDMLMMKSQPSSPVKRAPDRSVPLEYGLQQPRPRSQVGEGQMSQQSRLSARRHLVKSMIF
jgi:hypothetical protein